jgi:hypothetical protein
MAVSRRGFLKRTLLGSALLAAAGAVPLALRKGIDRALPADAKLVFLTPAEFSVFAAVADRVVPKLDPGQPSAGELGVALKVDQLLSRADADTRHDFKQLLGLFDNALAAFVLDGRTRPFTQLPPDEQDEALRQWRDSRLPLRRSGFQSLQRLSLALYYCDPLSYEGIGYPGPPLLARKDGTVVGGTEAQRAAYRASLLSNVGANPKTPGWQ